MTALARNLPKPGTEPASLIQPKQISASAVYTTARPDAGEIEYASWMPDAGALEYASWTAQLLSSRR